MAIEYRRHKADDADLRDILALIQCSFAYMDGRIDPPSSMHRLTAQDIARHCTQGEVWTMGDPIAACMFLSVEPEFLYVGKIAVAEGQRGRGLASQLIELAEDRARDRGVPALELSVRVELVENRATFEKLGFSVIAQRSHKGYARPTFLRMRRNVEPI